MRIMSGMRPTGDLHLGHLFGVLEQAVSLQDQGECFFEIADIHAYTTGYQDPGAIHEAVLSLVMDYLAAGLDPDRCTIFLQSAVPEIAQLYALLSMVTPLPYLERQPTYKGYLATLQGEDRASFGFLGYPLLQMCDIIAFDATHVPVGEDQLAHIELAGDLVHRFNHLYGKGEEILRAPQSVLSEAPYIPGTDNRKMSKSYGNTISLSETDEVTAAKIKDSYTDPTKGRKTDPGHPETCPVFAYRRLSDPASAEETAQICRAGGMGCVADKIETARLVNERLRAFRSKRADLSAQPTYVREVLVAGTQQARAVAIQTLERVRNAMQIFNVA